MVTGLYVQCKVYNSSNTLTSTVNLTESAVLGRYTGNVTLTTEGDYEAFYIAYTDSGHTVESELAPRASEALQITITSSTYGGATLPPSGGITEADIQEIISGVKSALKIENPWEYELSSGRTAEQELISKSEFDVKKDTVKIPKIDLSPIITALTEKVSEIKTSIPDVRNELNRLLNKKTEVNLTPVLSRIEDLALTLGKQLTTKDLESIEKKVDSISDDIKGNEDILANLSKKEVSLKPVLDKFTVLLAEMKKNILRVNDLESVTKSLSALNDNIKKTQDTLLQADELQLGRFNKLLKYVNDKFDGILNKVERTYKSNLYGKLESIHSKMYDD